MKDVTVIIGALILVFGFSISLAFLLHHFDEVESKKYLDKMSVVCGTDHFVSENKVANGLTKITCMTNNGEEKFYFFETKP